MVKKEHLNNAPITEALIDIRVENTGEFTIEKLESITKLLPSDYTDIKPQNRVFTEIQINTDDNQEPEVTNSKNVIDHIGYICRTKDEKNVAQLRLDGFTFSELRPYSNWEVFSEKAKEIWEIYCRETNCQNILRLAVRYINHLELPLKGGDDFNKYLTAAPPVPGELPQGISEFLSRVTIPNPEGEIVAHVTQTFQYTSNNSHASILLDIDVFKQNCGDIHYKGIWSTLDVLRKFKNEIFFNYITQEAKELFK